jgi:hypothetical protein
LTIKFTHEQQTRFQISNFRFETHLTLRNFRSLFTPLLRLHSKTCLVCSFYLTSHLKISDLKFQDLKLLRDVGQQSLFDCQRPLVTTFDQVSKLQHSRVG